MKEPSLESKTRSPFLTVKGSCYQLQNITDILHIYQRHMSTGYYGAFLHDVKAAILVFQNNETAALL